MPAGRGSLVFRVRAMPLASMETVFTERFGNAGRKLPVDPNGALPSVNAFLRVSCAVFISFHCHGSFLPHLIMAELPSVERLRRFA